MAARSGHHTGVWGPYLAAAQLPNVSGATVQDRFLRKGDIGTVIVSGVATIYTCTTATLAAGVWSEINYVGKAQTMTSGISVGTAISGVENRPITVATVGTDTAFADGTHFVTSIFLPVNFTCTSIGVLLGSVGGTDKIYGVIYDADGAVTASTDTTSSGTAVTAGTAAQIQTMNLHNDTTDTPVALVGPAMYYVGISANGTTAKLRTVPAYMGGPINAGSVSQTHGTIAAITEPTTFTAAKAPYIVLR